MKCPIDDTVLQMTDRQGIEIDYCPQCRGVWLDRGELDKIIDRADAPPSRHEQPQAAPPPSYERHDTRSYPSESYGDRRHDSGHYKKRKKESLLGELVDF